MHKNRINRNRFQPSNFSFGAVCKIFFRMKILGSPHVAGFYGARRSQNVLKYLFFVCLVVFCLRNFHAERNLMLVFVDRKERNNLVLWSSV